MTLLQHIYAVKNILSHGPSSDDFSFSESFIAHMLQVARAQLMYDKDLYYISEQNYQDLCLDLELASFHECCDTPEFEDCKILKSTIELPKFLDSKFGNSIKVMDLLGNVLPEIKLTQNKYSQYAIIKPKTGWFLHNNRIYLVNTQVMTKVLINALFDSPEVIHSINCPTQSNTCTDYYETAFPIDSNLIQKMYEKVIQLISASFKLPYDSQNNARDVQQGSIQ